MNNFDVVRHDEYVSSPMLMRKINIPKGLRKYTNGMTEVNLRASNFAHIVHGLAAMFGSEIKRVILEHNWYIKFDDEYTDDKHVHNLKETKVIDMFFVVEGAGNPFKIIVGALLIVVGVVVTGMSFGAAAAVGGALINAGIGLILTSIFTPKAQADKAGPEENNSFLFNNPTNVMEQGGAVPLAYGRSLTGSVVMTVGIDTEQIAVYTSPLGGNRAPNDMWGIIIQQ